MFDQPSPSYPTALSATVVPVGSGLNPLNLNATPVLPVAQGRILLIDPNRYWHTHLTRMLQQAGHTVIAAADGISGMAQFTQAAPFDLILIASHIPGSSGLSVCVSLRRQTHLPIIMLCDGHDTDHVLFSIQLGADDCLDRSTHWQILHGRIQALLRRIPVLPVPERSTVFVADELCFNPDCGHVTIGDRVIHLTPFEARLLAYFIEHQERTVTTRELLHEVWGYPDNDTSLVRVAIYRLRHKLESAPDCPINIVTVAGGYKFGARAGG